MTQTETKPNQAKPKKLSYTGPPKHTLLPLKVVAIMPTAFKDTYFKRTYFKRYLLSKTAINIL